MIQETIESFELLIEKTEKLKSYNFIKNPKLSSFEWSDNDGNETLMINGHSDESIEAFILTYRFFFDKKEHCSFFWLFNNVLDDPGLSDNWKNEFCFFRQNLNKYLNSYPDFKVTNSFYQSPMTNKDILDLFLYCDLSHATWVPDNRKKFNKLMSTKISKGFFKTQFIVILYITFYEVMKLSELCELELKNITPLNN